MKNNDFAVSMNRGGELIQRNSHKFITDKYKPDNPFLWGPIPYFLMILCIGIDVSVFYSLFVRISYDNTNMIWIEVSGLAFAADIVATYAGILAKRIKQGLSRDKLNLGLLLLVPILALIINGILRVTTMSLSSADGTVDAATIALTIFSIVTPVFTSIGNFAIGFQSYDPLAKRMCREEIELEDIRDYCRRLEAIKEECDNCIEEHRKCRSAMDQQHLINAKKELINDALIRSAAVEVKLMEYLGDPASTNVLSKSHCDEIFERLNCELKALTMACDKNADAEKSEVKELYGEESGAMEPEGMDELDALEEPEIMEEPDIIEEPAALEEQTEGMDEPEAIDEPDVIEEKHADDSSEAA